MPDLDPSDWMFLAAPVLVLGFVLAYALPRPRVWVRSPLGWVVVVYGIAMAFSLSLIDYAVLFEERMPTLPRFIIGLGVCLAITAKIVLVIVERSLAHRRRQRERGGQD